MSTTGTNGPATPPPRLPADEAERIWRARDRYRAKSFLHGLAVLASAIVILCILTFLFGCQDMSRSVAKLTGCQDQALDKGYCRMPKAVQP